MAGPRALPRRLPGRIAGIAGTGPRPACVAAAEDHPVTITRAEFDAAVDLLRRADFPIDTPLDEAWEQFRVSRSRYEYAVYAMARELDATPAPWSGPRRVPTGTMWPTRVVDLLPEVSPPTEADDNPTTDGVA